MQWSKDQFQKQLAVANGLCYPSLKTSITQWFVLVLVSGRDHMTQKPILIDTWYIIGIYGPLGDYMLPPVTRTEETLQNHRVFPSQPKKNAYGQVKHGTRSVSLSHLTISFSACYFLTS